MLGQVNTGSAEYVPRWDMKITSRSRFRPPSIAIFASPTASSPGPPASHTIGSGFGVADAADTIATPRVIFRPVGSARFSGTVSVPQRAPLSSATGSGVFGQGPGSKRASPTVRATVPMGVPGLGLAPWPAAPGRAWRAGR